MPTRERHMVEESAGGRVAASRERFNAGEVGWMHTHLELLDDAVDGLAIGCEPILR